MFQNIDINFQFLYGQESNGFYSILSIFVVPNASRSKICTVDIDMHPYCFRCKVVTVSNL